MVKFLENVFLPYLLGFSAKNHKNFKGGKIRYNDEEAEYFEKKNAFF